MVLKRNPLVSRCNSLRNQELVCVSLLELEVEAFQFYFSYALDDFDGWQNISWEVEILLDQSCQEPDMLPHPQDLLDKVQDVYLQIFVVETTMMVDDQKKNSSEAAAGVEGVARAFHSPPVDRLHKMYYYYSGSLEAAA